MKREELEKIGLTKEQVDAVCDLNNAEIGLIKDELKKAQDDLKLAQDKAETAEAALKKFDGVKPEELNKEITDLRAELKKKDDDYAAELANRDFDSLLKDSITAVKGRNEKAIKALLDVDTLKASKNQKEDVAAALKALTEAEDSKMLFGEPEPSPIGTGNLIGQVQKTSGNVEDAVMRAAMGLPPVAEQK